MNTVELHQAFSWTCPDCGIGQYASAITLSPEQVPAVADPEELQMIEEMGLDGVWVQEPSVVKCGRCETEYRTATQESSEDRP